MASGEEGSANRTDPPDTGRMVINKSRLPKEIAWKARWVTEV